MGRDVEEGRGSSGPSRTLHHHGNTFSSSQAFPSSSSSSLVFSFRFQKLILFSFRMKEPGGHSETFEKYRNRKINDSNTACRFSFFVTFNVMLFVW